MIRLPLLAPLLAVLAAVSPAATTPPDPAAYAGTAQLVAQYDFENIPAYIPDWGAGHGSTYKPATGWKTPFKVSLDSVNPHSGDKSLRIDIVDLVGGEKIIHSPSIAIPEVGASSGPLKLTVRLFVRTQGIVEGGAAIRVLERNAKGASVRLLDNQKSLAPILPTASWKELSASGTLSPGTRSVSFMVVIYKQPAPATIWIDDVSLEVQPQPAAATQQ